jgi:hypothetical protein
MSDKNYSKIALYKLNIYNYVSLFGISGFRQFQFRMGRENFCSIHVSLVPQPSATGEHKTKPTQVPTIISFMFHSHSGSRLL